MQYIQYTINLCCVLNLCKGSGSYVLNRFVICTGLLMQCCYQPGPCLLLPLHAPTPNINALFCSAAASQV